MHQRFQYLSVMEIAEICGVARSTVSYWISKKSLDARRSGKKHMVSIDDLILFLRSEGHPVPAALLSEVNGDYSQLFKPLKRCWEYRASQPYEIVCQKCSVFKYQINECFTVRNNRTLKRQFDCHKCRYFDEYYGPRVAFIHQIEKPAVIYKDLYLWSGNKAWADLCGIDGKKLIGTGVEEFICPDSLKKFIIYNKMRVQGDPAAPDRYKVSLSRKNGEKMEVYLAISPLIRPMGTWLAVAEDLRPKI